MANTGKGFPRSLQNVDFSVLDIPVAPATTSEVGGVKKAAKVNFPAGITSAAGGQSAAEPTKVEFDALVAEYNKLRNDVIALRNTVATLVTALKNAGTVS